MRIAFDSQKLATGALGLLAACLAYGTLTWLGAQTGERGAQRVFTFVGAIAATCICVLFSGLIARMATVQLIDQRRVGAAELRQFMRERWSTLLGIPLAFGGIVLLALALEAIMALVGAVPGLGPIVFSSSFLLAFFLSLTAVMAAAVHTVGAFIYPSIVAIRGVGAIGAMIEIVELARRKPLYVIIYELIVAAVGFLMTLIIGVAVWASLSVTNWAASSIMGEKWEQTLAALPGFFRVFLKPFSKVIPIYGEEFQVAWHYDVSGFLLGASLLVIVVLTLVYPFVFFTSAGSITYLILRTEPAPPERSPIEDL